MKKLSKERLAGLDWAELGWVEWEWEEWEWECGVAGVRAGVRAGKWWWECSARPGESSGAK